MKIWWILFALFLAMTVLVGWLLVQGEPGKWHGFDHPNLPHMSVGGPAQERTGSLPFFAIAFGVLQIIAFVLMLYVGLDRRQDDTSKKKTGLAYFFVISTVVYVSLFVTIFVLYSFEIKNESTQIAGLPSSTWQMLFVFWPFPFIYIVFYSLKFGTYVGATTAVAKDGATN